MRKKRITQLRRKTNKKAAPRSGFFIKILKSIKRVIA
jgi:hypothetical protein